MPRLALKIDVDTDRGTAEGVPRLTDALQKVGADATFLFSLGPDNTGRALRRVFRRGFLGKVRRTSVLQHYGLKTLLYGVLLPGPHIGRRRAPEMKEVARRGFEVGVHTYDHTRWQDGVANADRAWTRRELALAQAQFTEIFGKPARMHGAAGWQLNDDVPGLESELGFEYASDTRGVWPFMPVINGKAFSVPQIPTTLPTLDELLGLFPSTAAVREHVLTLTEPRRDQVFTLHAELEGGALLATFLELLRGWLDQGYELCSVATLYKNLDLAQLPKHTILKGRVEGRSGTLAVQGAQVS
ncbi:MAG: polysaccharide deacetylase family protein [Gammaproteobacteria bacterium]